MAGRVIRVWLDGSTDENELRALKAWLEREKPLEEYVRNHELLIEERPRKDAPSGRMGADWEIVLRVIEAAGSMATLAEQTKRAVDAWRANRDRVGQGEPPTPQVDESDEE